MYFAFFLAFMTPILVYWKRVWKQADSHGVEPVNSGIGKKRMWLSKVGMARTVVGTQEKNNQGQRKGVMMGGRERDDEEVVHYELFTGIPMMVVLAHHQLLSSVGN